MYVPLLFERSAVSHQYNYYRIVVGKWQRSGTYQNNTYHYKWTSYFTLKRTAAGNVVAVGYEYSTTTYTGFVCPGKTNGQSLPPNKKDNYELSDFKVASKSSISFTRAALSSGVTWKVEGDLHTNGKWLSVTMKRAGLDTPTLGVYKRVE